MNALAPLPLPTDNLYKFCALTGVAMTLFFYYTAWRFSDDLLRRINVASLTAKKAEIERDFLNRQIDRLEKTINDLKANESEEDVRKEGKIPLYVSAEELRKKMDQMHELLRDQSLKFAEADFAFREVAEAQMNLNFVRIFGLLVAGTGCSLAVYGFRKWHGLQKIQDRALERQLAEVQSESGPRSAR